MENKLYCSIGVICYNEAENIANLLDAILAQKLDKVNIKEIIVVSSASTDGTDDIVRDYETRDSRIRLITEPERRGKSAAINNFIQNSTTNILIIESGDTLPAKNTIEKLVSPFEDEKIGMTGGRPLPENPEDTFIGFAVNLLWALHHRMALISPKLGEMIVFRRCFESIPEKSAVDEASIEALIRDNGLEMKYIPDAIIHNKGPENFGDFIMQRKRIAAGHFWLTKYQNYSVASSDMTILIKITLAEIFERPLRIFQIFGTMILEMYCRVLGYIDFKIKKKNPFKWDMAKSTKKLKIRVK